jgi:hypothetical protein
MSAQNVTIISGVVLLVVFALAGLNLRRSRNRRGQDGAGGEKHP